MQVDHTALAEELYRARIDRRPLDPLSERFDLTADDAYRVQEEGLGRRVDDGEAIVGGKLGFTSEAMRTAMGIDQPNYGWVTDAMELSGGTVALSSLIHPKVEPEIAFVLGEDLDSGAGVEDVLSATSGVTACLEVVDSRFRDFRFGPTDNIADDSSAAAFVLGERVAPVGSLDLAAVGVVMKIDGQAHARATGAAVMEHPAAAVAWMAGAARVRGLRRGDIVLSGGLTAPVTLTRGLTVSVEIEHIGTATLKVR